MSIVPVSPMLGAAFKKATESSDNKTVKENELFTRDGLDFLNRQKESSLINFYGNSDKDFPAPPIPSPPPGQDPFPAVSSRNGAKLSIFNRYSVFYFNNTISNGLNGGKAEDYLDSVNRISKQLAELRLNPTANRLIKWSQEGNTNAVEYAIEDFLWCKNYGAVPNNYLVTLRRFTNPIADDLFDKDKVPVPDIGRLLTWIDGKENKWENAGLSWDHGFEWKNIKADVQIIDSTDAGWGVEKSGFSAPGILQAGFSSAQLENSKIAGDQVGYKNNNLTYGPIDVVNQTNVRERGVKFTQNIKLTFEYKLKSIDGINPKIAFIDLLSNILIVTSNRAPFWGGDVKYYGTSNRKLKPFGDPKKLQEGGIKGWSGYIESVIKGLSNTFNSALNGAKLFSAEGISNLFGEFGGNLLNQLAGAQLDKMGRPGVIAIDSLLTGDPTGSWHLTVGNPANPIMSIGNLILKNTRIEFSGVLGVDDFPTELKVICELEPGMPRDRVDIISMFHRNNRTYLTTPPQATKYTANVEKITRKNGGNITAGGKSNQGELIKIKEAQNTIVDKFGLSGEQLRSRFPNHFDRPNAPNNSAEQIG